MAEHKLQKLNKEDISIHKATQLSLMPEELEKAMTFDEFKDLVAFLLTKSPQTK